MNADLRQKYMLTMYWIDKCSHFAFTSIDIQRIEMCRDMLIHERVNVLKKLVGWLRKQYIRGDFPDVWWRTRYYHNMRKAELVNTVKSILGHIMDMHKPRVPVTLCY